MKFDPKKIKNSTRNAVNKKTKGESLLGKNGLVNTFDGGIEGSETLGFTTDIFNKIDFNVRDFIAREAKIEEMLEDPEVEALARSINDVSLINPIYIQTHGTGYKIVSGYRRCCAIKYGIDNIEGFEVVGKIIALPSDAVNLEVLQVNENTHRAKLSDVELGYRIETYAKKNNISNEEAFKRYNLTSVVGKRAMGSLNYPKELKNIVHEVGPAKSFELNKLIKALNGKMAIVDILDNHKDLTRDEIRQAVKDAKKNYEKDYYIHKLSKKSFKLEIQESATIEDICEIEKFIRAYFKGKK